MEYSTLRFNPVDFGKQKLKISGGAIALPSPLPPFPPSTSESELAGYDVADGILENLSIIFGNQTHSVIISSYVFIVSFNINLISTFHFKTYWLIVMKIVMKI